jgi:hypothetical protein
MKQVILDIPDNKMPFFMELVNSLGFVKKVDTVESPTKEQFLSELKTTLTELKKGKLKTTPAKDFLNEL